MSKGLPSFRNGSEALDYAHRQRKENQLAFALPAFREAEHLFKEEGNRRQAMQASSWHLTLERNINEQDLRNFLEKYSDFSNDKSYLLCKQKYLKQISIRSNQEENYQIAEDALKELADLVESNRDVFNKIPQEQINIWRIQAILAASHNSPDIEKRIKYYKEAANLSSPQKGLNSVLANKIRAYKAIYLSEAEKLSAFTCVRRGNNRLNDAIEHMSKAIQYAQDALKMIPKKFDLQLHYLSYWCNMFLARKRIEDRLFSEALQYLECTIGEAKNFPETSVFPNYFANKLDLYQEKYLVEAYIAFSERNFNRSSLLLNNWLDTMKESMHGSWKYANVAVRKIVTDVLSKGLLPPPAEKVKKSIDKARESVRVGTACCKLADLVTYAATTAERNLLTSEVYNEIINKCIVLFPLSSGSKDYQVSIDFYELSPYKELPAYFGEFIKRADQLDGEVLFNELDQCLRAYLLVICDYYNQKREALVLKGIKVRELPVEFSRDFPQMCMDRLANAVIQLLRSIGKMPKGRRSLVTEFQWWLNEYCQLRTQFHENRDSEVAKQMFQLMKQKLIGETYIEMFPLVIQIVSSRDYKNNKQEYLSQVLWQRPGAEEMILQGSKIFEVGKYYYLKPHWKNFYHATQNTDHPTFEVYRSLLFEEYVINEYKRYRDRHYIHELKWRCYEFPYKIEEFKKIINDPGKNQHKKIVHFLFENQWMLCPYHYKQSKFEHLVQEKFRIDLFFTRYDEGEIWEIKLPSARLFNANSSRTSELDKALGQLENYQRIIKENAQRLYYQGGVWIGKLSGFLLIGREGGSDQKKLIRVLNEDISRNNRVVLTYDDLICKANELTNTIRNYV